jgi:hypothetical protein
VSASVIGQARDSLSLLRGKAVVVGMSTRVVIFPQS